MSGCKNKLTARPRGRPWEVYTQSEVREIKKSYPRNQYPQLHRERMYCKRHVLILLSSFLASADLLQDGTPFPFMRLPVALRLEVYKYHLIQDSPIELWPHVQDNIMHKANLQRSINLSRFIGLKYTLSFLRVSSTINREAAQVFYGANEFRFSALNAWMVLSAFLHTIGSRHFQFLQHLTIHVPFPGIDNLALPTMLNSTFKESACILRPKQYWHFRTHLGRIFQIPENWSHDWCFADCVEKLTTTDLCTFRLVLPPTYYIDHSSSLSWYWNTLRLLKDTVDARRAANNQYPLRVGFVFLKIRDEEQEVSARTREICPWLNRYTGQVKRMMGKLGETKWIGKVEYGVHDKRGRYTVVEREQCGRIAGSGALEKEEINEEDWMVTEKT